MFTKVLEQLADRPLLSRPLLHHMSSQELGVTISYGDGRYALVSQSVLGKELISTNVGICSVKFVLHSF